MQRYKAIVEYDGTGLAGWQAQKSPAMPTVQEFIEEAIFKFCQETVRVQCSGRTDAGVHARGQVIHFDLEAERELYKIQHGINYHLENKPTALLNIEKVHAEFNARFDAKKRYYRYHIINRQAPLVLEKNRAWCIHKELDIPAMREAAGFLVGQHDFSSFRAAECQANSPIKTLDKISISQEGDTVYIDVEGLSFLHNMVRNIVGTLKLVGEGKWQPADVKKALEAKDRCAAGPTAPACGLYFMKVDY